MELLVARTQRRYKEICLRIFQMSTEQDPTSKETWGAISIGNTTEAMARDQH